MHSLALLWVLLACAAAIAAKSVPLCPNDKQTPINIDAIELGKVDLELSKTTKYTWQATRGIRNITIEYTKDVIVETIITGKTLKIKGKTDKDGSSILLPSGSILAALVIGQLMICRDGYRVWILLLVVVTVMLFSHGMTQNSECLDRSTIRLLLPAEQIEELCVNGNCVPVLCQLSLVSVYSSIPSNNEVVFEDDVCTIRHPGKSYDEFLEHYFGVNESKFQDFYGDYDGDGLTNIMEYHGKDVYDDLFRLEESPYKDDTYNNITTTSRRRRQAVAEIGTNPVDADSDGDLLQDGFELLNKMDPTVKDETEGDLDGDGLTNLKEQILNTDPRNPDSDGDGVPDGKEIEDGGSPTNPADEGHKSSEQTADVKLTVGDHSGSHSERYILHVGSISHQSPGYGLVGSGIYTFPVGTYKITLQHSGTNRHKPDYDYTAIVEKVSGDAEVIITDTDGMMGYHGESDPFYAAGKFATMIIEENCPEDVSSEECECNKLKSCVACRGNEKCAWKIGSKICTTDSMFLWGPTTVHGDDELCPCEECLNWYNQEKHDTQWLGDLNRELPCPCTVTELVNTVITPRRTFTVVTVVASDPDVRATWKADLMCQQRGSPFCSTFHPGASACLRSASNTAAGARQQCCYASNGNLLAPDHQGAGTPDRAGTFWKHQEVDVKTYKNCCKKCEDPTYCKYYKDLRKGSNSHCT